MNDHKRQEEQNNKPKRTTNTNTVVRRKRAKQLHFLSLYVQLSLFETQGTDTEQRGNTPCLKR